VDGIARKGGKGRCATAEKKKWTAPHSEGNQKSSPTPKHLLVWRLEEISKLNPLKEGGSVGDRDQGRQKDRTSLRAKGGLSRKASSKMGRRQIWVRGKKGGKGAVPLKIGSKEIRWGYRRRLQRNKKGKENRHGAPINGVGGAVEGERTNSTLVEIKRTGDGSDGASSFPPKKKGGDYHREEKSLLREKKKRRGRHKSGQGLP